MGHQEIMGTCPKPPLVQPFQVALDRIEKQLLQHGYRVTRRNKDGLSLLVVNEGVVIGDNLEADLGQVYNLTCNFNLVSFDQLLSIAEQVRKANSVSRNIAFGGNITFDGNPLSMESIFNAIETKNSSEGVARYIGVNSPDSGVYEEGFKVAHLGYGVDA